MIIRWRWRWCLLLLFLLLALSQRILFLPRLLELGLELELPLKCQRRLERMQPLLAPQLLRRVPRG